MSHTITLTDNDWNDLRTGLLFAVELSINHHRCGDCHRIDPAPIFCAHEFHRTRARRWEALHDLLAIALCDAPNEPDCCGMPDAGDHARTCPRALARRCDDCASAPGQRCDPWCGSLHV